MLRKLFTTVGVIFMIVGLVRYEWLGWQHWDLTTKGLAWNYPRQVATCWLTIFGGGFLVLLGQIMIDDPGDSDGTPDESHLSEGG